jgi:ketosteroid isomerase-like protein
MRSIKRSILTIPLVLLGCALGSAAADAQPRAGSPPPSAETLHNELRALRERTVNAVNKRDPDAVMKELHPDIVFTAMDTEVVRGIPAAKAYYQKMFVGAARIVEGFSLTVEPDAAASLYENGKVAISRGSSNAHFKLATGTEFDVPLRWSATLLRENNKWTIANLQFTANMFNNPILDVLKSSMKWVALGTGVAALIVGFLLGWLVRRRSA